MKNSDSDRERRVSALLSRFVDQANAGIAPSAEQFLAENESLRSDLEPLLGALGLVGPGLQSKINDNEMMTRFTLVHNRLLPRKPEQDRSTTTVPLELPIDKRPDFLILLLATAGEIWGVTRLFKLLFLLGKEAKASEYVGDYYAAVAHNFGPFEEGVYRDIEGLKRIGILSEVRPVEPTSAVRDELSEGDKSPAVYRLTNKGRQIAAALRKGADKRDADILPAVNTVCAKYGRLNLRQLLKYVYKTYPEYTKNSKIREDIFGSD